MASKSFRYLAAFGAALVALPQASSASIVINSIGSNPQFQSGKITLTGHFSNMGANAGRFSLGGTEQPGGVPVNFLTFCIDLLHMIGSGTFEIKPLSAMVSDATKRNQLGALLTQTQPLITGVTQNDRNIATAVQLAVWEIISETSNSGYSLTAGLFSAKNFNGATTSLASAYLGNVSSGVWQTAPGKSLAVLYSPRNQSQVFITAVPEPATWLTMIAGFGLMGFAMRRRHLWPTKARMTLS